MKNTTYIIILFLGLSNIYATEKDSLTVKKPFINFYQFTTNFEDDCDACSCSANGGSMGFASMINSNFVGVRYINQSYKSNDGLYSNSPWLDENFNTIQVWGRVPISKKIQISALLPYHFHNRETQNGLQAISGIGDATILGMYTLYETKSDTVSTFHTIQLGGGIKIPTGKFNQANNGSINPSYQVGTGSWDYHLTSEYVIKKNKLGLNTMLNYVIKTENQKNYRFGNQFNYATTFFYLIENKDFTIVPLIGLSGEIYETNYQLGQKVRGTSGDIFMGRVGFEIGKNKLSFGVTTMLPITQNLTNGNVKNNYRLSFNLNYSL